FTEPCLACGDLEICFAGDAIDRVAERKKDALIGCVHPDKDSDAQRDAHDGQDGTERVLFDIGPGDEPKQNHRCTSSTTRPSRRVMVRSQVAATLASCVTITTVDPNRSCRSRISRRISSPMQLSRLPVGSSASSMGG